MILGEHSEKLTLEEEIEDLILDIKSGESNDKIGLLLKIREYSEDVFAEIIRGYMEESLIPIDDLGQTNIDNINIGDIEIKSDKIVIKGMDYSFDISDININLIDLRYVVEKHGVVEVNGPAIEVDNVIDNIPRVITGIMTAQEVPVYKLENNITELLRLLNLTQEEENQRIKELAKREDITEDEARVMLLNENVKIARLAMEVSKNANKGFSEFLSSSVVKLGNLKEKKESNKIKRYEELIKKGIYVIDMEGSGKVSILNNNGVGKFKNKDGEEIFDDVFSKNGSFIATKVGKKVVLQGLGGLKFIEWDEEKLESIDKEIYEIASKMIKYGHTGKLIKTEGKEKFYGEFKIYKEKQKGNRKLMNNYYFDSKGYFTKKIVDNLTNSSD